MSHDVKVVRPIQLLSAKRCTFYFHLIFFSTGTSTPNFCSFYLPIFWYNFVFFSFETRFHCTTDADLDVSFSCLSISNTEIISVCMLQLMYLYMIDSWEWEWEAKKEFKKLSDLIVKTEFSRSTVNGCLVFIFFNLNILSAWCKLSRGNLYWETNPIRFVHRHVFWVFS